MENSIDTEGPRSVLMFLTETLAPDFTFYLLGSIALILLLIFSALVSGSEVASFSLSSDDLKECSESNSKNDQIILDLLREPRRLLATILIFNNFINVAIVTLSAYLAWTFIGSRDTSNWIFVSSSAVVTILIVFFGEVIPKVYATQKSLRFARSTAKLMYTLNYIAKPLAVSLMSMTQFIEKRFRDQGYSVSVEELHKALEIATGIDTSDEQREILKGIANFGTLSVRQIMRSRIDITAVDIKIDFHQLMDKINKCGYSRIPVYRDTIDNITGIVYVKDLLPFINNDEDFKWQQLLRPAYFIPETKMIDDLLRSFQNKHVHIAIVVDEYGGTAGLLTLEDIIEEIVGEINDEFDAQAVDYIKINDNSYVFEGKTSLYDMAKILDIKPDIFDKVKGESESIGGLLLELHAKMPKIHDVITYDHFVFKIESVNSKRIKKVRIDITESIQA